MVNYLLLKFTGDLSQIVDLEANPLLDYRVFFHEIREREKIRAMKVSNFLTSRDHCQASRHKVHIRQGEGLRDANMYMSY